MSENGGRFWGVCKSEVHSCVTTKLGFPGETVKDEDDDSDCEQFAQFLETLATRFDSDEDFVNALGELVAGFPDGKACLRCAQPPQVTFGGAGFRDELNDGDGHPARHFTANFVLGFQQGRTTSELAAIVREIPGMCSTGCSLPDVRLGVLGAKAGNLLRFGGLRRAAVGQWVRDNL